MIRFTDAAFKRLFVVALLAVAALVWNGAPRVEAQNGNGQGSLTARVNELERALDLAFERIGELEDVVESQAALLACAHLEEGEVNGLAGPHFVFEGCNVHVRNSTGVTYEPDGTGNLIVGHNEPDTFFGSPRDGSHNLVVGPLHTYSSYGGFVAGFHNVVTAPHASVSGGSSNTASGTNSSVSGGNGNEASGFISSISGGLRNTATGSQSSINGGADNIASGPVATVSGGGTNIASGNKATVSGGSHNVASGLLSVVAGGFGHEADGDLELAP